MTLYHPIPRAPPPEMPARVRDGMRLGGVTAPYIANEFRYRGEMSVAVGENEAGIEGLMKIVCSTKKAVAGDDIMSDYTCLSISSSGSVLIAETDCSNASTVGWVANPNGRGTVSLVLSCTLTLGLCVWSAMHLNIPPPTNTEWQIWRRNVRWTFMGVFGPELVMYVAWRQWSSSKALSTKVQECVSNHRKPLHLKQGIGGEKREPPEPVHPWTLMHSFYASMGGFVFDLDPSDEYPAFFPGCQRLTLTARGVALIAILGHLPNINKDDIADKSKADGLAKAFVCLQAAWVVIQVISRCIIGLPITLLEVNTLGHAFCAFVIYILWWNKPRLIDQPTVLKGEWVRSVCAYMYMNSEMSGWEPANTNIIRKSWKDPEFNTLVLCVGSGDVSQTNKTIIKTGVGLVSEDLVESTPESIRTLGTDDCTLREATSGPEMANNTEFLIKVSPLPENAESEHFMPRPRTLSEAEEGSTSTNPREQSGEERSMQVRRWQLASEALQRYPILRERFSPIHHDPQASHPQCFTPTVEELVTRYSSNWPSPTLLKRSDAEGKKMGMVLWCASMAYGAVHVAAWNYYFPSHVEAILWRFSAITISGSGLIWLLINGLAHKSRYWNAYWGRFVKMRCSWFSYTVIGFMSAVCGLAYVLSRVFLVVEAFVSIRKLPLAAYATPDWIQAIPHL